MTNRLPVASMRDAWTSLWQIAKRYPRAAILAASLSLVTAALQVVMPLLVGRMVDAVRGGHASTATIHLYGGLCLASVLLAAGTYYICERTASVWAERVAYHLRNDVAEGALGISMKTVENTPAGDLTTRASADISAVRDALRISAVAVLVITLQLLAFLVAVVVTSPALTPALLVMALIVIQVYRYYTRRSPAAYLAERTVDGGLADVISETASGARTLEATNSGQNRLRAIDDKIGELHRTRMRTLWLRTVMFPGTETGLYLAEGVALVFGGWLVMRGDMTLGTLTATVFLLQRISDPLMWLTEVMEQMQNANAALQRVVGVKYVPPAQPPTSAVPTDDVMVVDQVSYRYAPDLPTALDAVDLTIQPGERLAIVGPSGAGKTTLGRLLAGFDAPTEGSVLVGGVPVYDLPTEELSRRVLMVTQDHHVFAGTLRENLALASTDATDEQLLAALKTVGTHLQSFPDGLDTVVGKGGVETDGALAQQIALARVIVAGPHTVILDEATSLLSPADARHAEQDLNAALAGRSVVAIAHRLQTAHDADRIAVVDEGRIVELGSHDELLAAGGRYAKLWRTWHGS